jgi:hypothetical protein
MYYSGYCSNQGDFEYTNLCIFEYTNLLLIYKFFCANRHINVTLKRSATECAQLVSGTCLFIIYLFIYLFIYLYIYLFYS